MKVVTWLVGNKHTVENCDYANGAKFNIGVIGEVDINYICKFAGQTCPTGWNKYGNWTTTLAQSCFGGSCSGGCGTGSHLFSDNPNVETCGYSTPAFVCEDDCHMGCAPSSCSASVTEVGCN